MSWAACLSGNKSKPDTAWQAAGLRHGAACNCATGPGSTRGTLAVHESLKSFSDLLSTSGRSISLLLGYEQQQIISCPFQIPLPPCFSSFTEGGGEVPRKISCLIPCLCGWEMGEQRCTSLFLPTHWAPVLGACVGKRRSAIQTAPLPQGGKMKNNNFGPQHPRIQDSLFHIHFG